jgi:hypothetical protein
LINPYLDQTIADQFQAEADLSEFDPLDIAVLGNVASKKKNDIGINKLKQDAAFGLTPMQSVFKLYEEKRQAEEELAQRQAETDRYGNQAKIIDSEVGQMVGPTDQELRQRGLYGFQNATPIMGDISKQGFMGAVGQPDATSPYRDLSAPQASVGASPYELAQPGTMPMTPAPVDPLDLATRYGVLGEEKANLQREYASDAGYNQAMAAVREALGKAPNVPTMAKPQLTQEDQALIALAGIFGGFQNMPQALQGALAGAQQRAEIQNQQLQNKFQQEQAAYGRQLQGLQGIAQTEEERRQQEQKTLDRIYSTKLGKIEGEMAKIPYQQAVLNQGAQKIEQTGKRLELQERGLTIRQQESGNKNLIQARQAEINAWKEMLRGKYKQDEISAGDVKGMQYKRQQAIARLAKLGLSVPEDFFYIPKKGINPLVAMAQTNKVFNTGVDMARDIVSGKFFDEIPLDPKVEADINLLQSEIKKLRSENMKIDRDNSAEIFRNKTRELKKAQEDKTINQKEFNKLYEALMQAKAKASEAKKRNLDNINKYQNELNKLTGDVPVLPPANQGMTGPIGSNTVVTPLGTIKFQPKSSNA